MSSIITSHPSSPDKTLDICVWNSSGPKLIPMGMRQKQNLPTGVMNVVRGMLLMSSGTCQNPIVASRVENTVAPANLGAMSSRFGSMVRGGFTDLFNLLKSAQILTFPDFLTTGTIGAHQSVGSVQLGCDLAFLWKGHSSCCVKTVRHCIIHQLELIGSVLSSPFVP